MTTTLDMSMTLWEACNVFHADKVKLATLIELMGDLSEEQTDRVLYQASIVAAAEKISKTNEKE